MSDKLQFVVCVRDRQAKVYRTTLKDRFENNVDAEAAQNEKG
jgi:hypothetical protein